MTKTMTHTVNESGEGAVVESKDAVSVKSSELESSVLLEVSSLITVCAELVVDVLVTGSDDASVDVVLVETVLETVLVDVVLVEEASVVVTGSGSSMNIVETVYVTFRSNVHTFR